MRRPPRLLRDQPGGLGGPGRAPAPPPGLLHHAPRRHAAASVVAGPQTAGAQLLRSHPDAATRRSRATRAAAVEEEAKRHGNRARSRYPATAGTPPGIGL